MRKQTGEEQLVKKSGSLTKLSDNKIYIPDSGDLIWVDFDPRVGHEQSGHRPAIVVSLMFYNRRGKAIVCPITNQKRDYPFEIILPENINTTGVILADQVKSIDWKERKARFIEKVKEEVVNEVVLKIKAIFPRGL
jgi:mRNA interferase MazF